MTTTTMPEHQVPYQTPRREPVILVIPRAAIWIVGLCLIAVGAVDALVGIYALFAYPVGFAAAFFGFHAAAMIGTGVSTITHRAV